MIDRRGNTRRNLSPLYQPGYDRLCVSIGETTWKSQTMRWDPYNGIRAPDAQDRKYAQGRELVNGIWVVRDPGKVITNARGWQSPHPWGCATDWCLWTLDGEPHWPKPDDPVWKELIDAAVSAGLRSGADFGDVDHCELRINVPWSHIATVFYDCGPEAAKAAIQAAMAPPTLI